jgi:hypothetical protein
LRPTPAGPATGFLCSFHIQKNARWTDKFRPQHFFTKTDPIWARRVCKKGPLKGGRSPGGQLLSDIPPRPGRGRSPLRGQLVENLGRSATTPGRLSVVARGAPWPVAAAPPVKTPWAVDRWADGVGANGDLLRTARLCWS